ncbi:MAG: hypothetical protein AAGF79_09620 [Pseudomonadota bacterium]
MSAPHLTLPAGERGRVRVFSLSMSDDEAEVLEPADALGVAPLDPARVEIFPVKNLEGLGLTGYLVEGCGIPESEVARDRTRLDALDGHVLLLFSRAYGDTGVTLSPAPALTLIGSYDEDRPETTGPAPESASARPRPAKSSPRETRNAARRAGALVFGVVMAMLLLLVLVLIL